MQIVNSVAQCLIKCTIFSQSSKACHFINFPILYLAVPPRLGPLQFPAGTRAGMRAQVGCYAQEGDLPMQMSWRKDGQPLEPSFSVRISKTDDFASLLVITEVAAEHAGNYTCLASNAARTASTSAFLAVSGETRGNGWVGETLVGLYR